MAELTFPVLTKGRGAILVGTSPSHVYVDGVKTDQQDGITYYIVIPAKEYLRASVKVADLSPIVSNEELRTAMEIIDTFVEFDDFTARWYKNGKEWKLSCRASRAKLVTR